MRPEAIVFVVDPQQKATNIFVQRSIIEVLHDPYNFLYPGLVIINQSTNSRRGRQSQVFCESLVDQHFR